MKRIALAFAAVFAALAFGAPVTALAADKPAPFTKDQITQGMKEAPAVAQSAGLACTITNAGYLGASTTKDDKGKEIKQSIYEVACQEGLGYALIAPVGGTPKFYDCVAMIGNVNLSCRLPQNADPKRGLQPLVAKVSSQCTISDARYLGSKPTGENFYEIGCGAAPGFILQTAANQSPKTIGCDTVSGALACKFTTQAQMDAAANAAAGDLLAKSGKTCQMTKSRAIGQLQSGDNAYEVACQDGNGYVLEALPSGQFHAAINCANVANSCKLTDATKTQTAEAGTYTRLAKAGGFQCDVSQYRFIGMDTKTNSEVVELQCTNRADGAVGVFPANNSAGKFYDCVAVGGLGQSCKLTDPAAIYPKYTQALTSKGKSTCKVSGAHWLGVTASGDNFVETACSDGLPGWVMSMAPGGSVNELLTCGQAKSAGVACTLPGNVR